MARAGIARPRQSAARSAGHRQPGFPGRRLRRVPRRGHRAGRDPARRRRRAIRLGCDRGVVNIILKDAGEGGALSAQYGEYYESDGERLSVSGTSGCRSAPTGSSIWRASTRGPTSPRAVNARLSAAGVADIVGNDLVPPRRSGPALGDPEVEALKFSVNAGLDLSDSLEVYGFATYMDNTTKSDFFYRGPVIDDPAQPVGLPARTTLQIDNDHNATLLLAPMGSRPGPAVVHRRQLGQGLDPNDYLVPRWLEPQRIFVLRNPIFTEFPGGYNPDFGADLTDMSFVLGARGDWTDTLTWDLKGRYAENEVEYTLRTRSIRASAGCPRCRSRRAR